MSKPVIARSPPRCLNPNLHLWHVAGLSPIDDPLEAAVTAARVAVVDLAGMAAGRTLPRLRAVFVEWPLESVQMAERITGAHRATVLRNIDWVATEGLIREVTGQARCRMWWTVDPGQRAGRRNPGVPDQCDSRIGAFGG